MPILILMQHIRVYFLIDYKATSVRTETKNAQKSAKKGEKSFESMAIERSESTKESKKLFHVCVQLWGKNQEEFCFNWLIK